MSLAPVIQPDNCPMCGHPIPLTTEIKHDTESRIVIAGGKAVQLSKSQNAIFEMLSTSIRRTVNYDALITALYNLDEPVEPRESLTTIIHNLRHRLKGSGLTVVNHREAGYALVYEAREAA